VKKVLGVVWDSSIDTFSFKVTSDLLDCQEPIQLSKRKVLSQIARIYDPIGFASAIMIRGKIALQALGRGESAGMKSYCPDCLKGGKGYLKKWYS